MPDTPGLSTLDMQEKFDEPAKELCAPKINALIDALTAATGAADIGATAPQGLTGTNIQALINALKAYVDAHKSDTSNPHGVTAAQTGAYTKEETDAQIDQKVVSIGTGDMAQAVYDPDHLGEDATIQLYTHSKTGTIHNFVGSGANGRALITAEFEAGDSVALNGSTVTATCGPDPVDGDTIVNGKWVSFVADEDGGQINFKGGGGIGLTKLALANATADQVSNGRTFYAGNKTLKTGSLQERGQQQTVNTIGAGSGYIAINNIPEGIYRKNGADWAPEIRVNEDTLINYVVDHYRSKVISRLGIASVPYTWSVSNNQQGRPMSEVVGYFVVNFKIGNTNVNIGGKTPNRINTDASGSGSFNVT